MGALVPGDPQETNWVRARPFPWTRNFPVQLWATPKQKTYNGGCGEPNTCQQNDPDSGSIERLHAQYSAALIELYNKYNPIYGDSEVKLVIT